MYTFRRVRFRFFRASRLFFVTSWARSMAHLFSYQIYAKRVPLNFFLVHTALFCSKCVIFNVVVFSSLFALSQCSTAMSLPLLLPSTNIYLFCCNYLIVQFILQCVLFGRIIPHLTNETTDRVRQIHSLTPRSHLI